MAFYQGMRTGKDVRKFGDNDAVGTVLETVWAAGAVITYAAAAAASTIVSSDAVDKGVSGSEGTGARTVSVQGVGAPADGYPELTEVATLNGTDAVTLANEYFRINRLRVLTAGSGLLNAGTISAKIGANVAAYIRIGDNSTMQLAYCVPAPTLLRADTNEILLTNLTLLVASGKICTAELWIRPPAGILALRDRYEIGVGSNQLDITIMPAIALDTGSDIEIRAKIDSGTARVSGSFGIMWV